ncbi:MAG: zinc-domain-containing protein [Thermoproteota archaeon]|nr:zinc-domain-containing protein [Thermoproteota archaeon]
MDAKCFNCSNKAHFNIEKNKIICKKCNIEIDYDKYIETMKEKALNLADDLQSNWDKHGY